MSNIEKIRQEIERRKKRWMLVDLPLAIGRYYEDRDILAFIDSLPEEKLSKDLEEAADKFAVSYDQGTCDGIAQDCFIAGANWQKEQDKDWLNCELMKAHLSGVKAGDMIARTEMHIQKEEPSEDLEQAAARYERENRQSILSSVDIVNAFIEGARWKEGRR